MAYAFVAQVSLEGRSREESEQMLREQVIPAVKQQPGFRSGVWLRSQDGTTGMGVVVFDTEDDARAMGESMAELRPVDAPPITSTDVFEVTGQA